MKNIKVTNREEQFQPIEVSFTIETLEELCGLCKRLNISGDNVDKYGTGVLYGDSDNDQVSLSIKLDDIYKQRK
jgi:hypothetical protein